MNEIAYWIWLLRTLGPAAATADILRYFGSARGLYEAGSAEWRLSGLLTPSQITALTKYSPSESGGIMRTCVENGWQIVTPDSPLYPPRLRDLRNFPPVLFVCGDARVLTHDVQIAMVGTRKASTYGRRVAVLLASALAEAGAVIVSGGALGIDSAAHMGALSAHGKTVAVLGCGLGTNYLRENAALRTEIAKNGALISEFLPFSPASKVTFPLRNRIISGMTLGTVVIEAGERSGSLITARYALEQGRDVFAVPGDIISSAFTGANKLIHDGAKPVFTPLDILEEYVYTYSEGLHLEGAGRSLGEMLREHDRRAAASAPTTPAKRAARVCAPANTRANAHMSENTGAQAKSPESADAPTQSPQAEFVPLPETASERAKTVYAVLGEGLHIDDLRAKTQLPVSVCLAALTELELCGCVRSSQGRKYRKIRVSGENGERSDTP